MLLYDIVYVTAQTVILVKLYKLYSIRTGGAFDFNSRYTCSAMVVSLTFNLNTVQLRAANGRSYVSCSVC